MFEAQIPAIDYAGERLEAEVQAWADREPTCTVDTRGLSKQRSRLRRFLKSLKDERVDLARLNEVKAKLLAGLDAPAHEPGRTGALSRYAARITAWLDGDAVGTPPAPESCEAAEIVEASHRRAIAEAKAEALRPAIESIDHKLRVQRMRVDTLARRQPEFVHNAVCEEAGKLRDRFLEQVHSLNELANQLAGAQGAADRTPDAPVILPDWGMGIGRTEIGGKPDHKKWATTIEKWLSE
jgi:hypothetical protein